MFELTKKIAMKTIIIDLSIIVYVILIISSSIHFYLVKNHNKSLKGILKPVGLKPWVTIFLWANAVGLFIYLLN